MLKEISFNIWSVVDPDYGCNSIPDGVSKEFRIHNPINCPVIFIPYLKYRHKMLMKNKHLSATYGRTSEEVDSQCGTLQMACLIRCRWSRQKTKNVEPRLESEPPCWLPVSLWLWLESPSQRNTAWPETPSLCDTKNYTNTHTVIHEQKHTYIQVACTIQYKIYLRYELK